MLQILLFVSEPSKRASSNNEELESGALIIPSMFTVLPSDAGRIPLLVEGPHTVYSIRYGVQYQICNNNNLKT